MHILIKPISELQPAPYNPRVLLDPRDSHYRKLRRSLERFGLVEPLLWNSRTGYLVGGHQRLRILQELHYQQVPVVVLDLPVVQEKALNIILNNREAQGDWDLPQLTAVLQELASVDELASTGFDPSHLATLQADLTPADTTVEDEPETHYEITLRIPHVQLQTVRPELDDLIHRHQLEVHIKHR